MTFIPKSFTPVTELPALSLNDMDGNDDHVREEANYYQLASVRAASLVKTLSTISYRFYIDTTAVGTAITTSGDKVEADIPLSTTVGIHTLEIPALELKFRFFKTADMTYMTAWMTVKTPVVIDPANPSAGYTHTIENLTVIAHREAKSWT